jgi:hypothetical protein
MRGKGGSYTDTFDLWMGERTMYTRSDCGEGREEERGGEGNLTEVYLVFLLWFF